MRTIQRLVSKGGHPYYWETFQLWTLDLQQSFVYSLHLALHLTKHPELIYVVFLCCILVLPCICGVRSWSIYCQCHIRTTCEPYVSMWDSQNMHQFAGQKHLNNKLESKILRAATILEVNYATKTLGKSTVSFGCCQVWYSLICANFWGPISDCNSNLCHHDQEI